VDLQYSLTHIRYEYDLREGGEGMRIFSGGDRGKGAGYREEGMMGSGFWLSNLS
jgi:hypothetical protein